MKQIFSTANGVEVLEVPSPMVQRGEVLVEVEYSFVSSGTELATLSATQEVGRSLAAEVTSNPALAKRLVHRVREEGIKKSVARVRDFVEARRLRADRLVPMGYSCSGRVVGLGEDAALFRVGDRVACAGAARATHSELVSVPENLVALVPTECDMREAASVAVGAVAMQGVRRADVRLGEHAAVIGLGLVGLLAVQLLKASGVRVIGHDISEERAEQARRLGADEAFSELEEMLRAVRTSTGHMGVDACLITAGAESSEPVQTAMTLTRKNGKVVVVGAVGMNIQREPFLRKEIEILGSSSYGPGRYDELYEVKGIDYPYAYVRWTEKRNMEEYLSLLAERRVKIATIAEEYPLESAAEAYERLESSGDRPAAVIIKYTSERALADKARTRVDLRPSKHTHKIRFGVAGAGSFVRRVHLPLLKGMSDEVELAGILTRTGAGGLEVARQFGARYVATSYGELLDDRSIDALLIGTRHNLHGGMVLRALRAGKHVFVEKPLALTEGELRDIEKFYAGGTAGVELPVLLTGFNRRFSPLAARLKELRRNSRTPVIINYLMNAGYLPEEHWLRTEEGGGRNLGEACHIYDLFTYLTDSRVEDVKASSIGQRDGAHARNENFTATVGFGDGSVCTLTYTTMGSKAHPKEVLHAYADESVYVMTDYASLDIVGASTRSQTGRDMSKGHSEELRAFVRAIRRGEDWPIPLWQQLQASRIALAVEAQIAGGT